MKWFLFVQIYEGKKTNLHEEQQHHPTTPVTVHATTVHDVPVLIYHKFFEKIKLLSMMFMFSFITNFFKKN
jgi:hypothetical protein